MPLVSAIRTPNLLIQIGNGASPEIFTNPCMINTSRGIEFSSTTVEDTVPFCPVEEDVPGWVERSTDSLQATITGAGIFDTETLSIFDTWFHSGLEKNIRVRVNADNPVDHGWWSGAWLLSQFSVTGPGRRERVTFDCTIVSSGEILWTVSSAAAV